MRRLPKVVSYTFVGLGALSGLIYLYASIYAIDWHPHGKYGDLESRCNGSFSGDPLPKDAEFTGDGVRGWRYDDSTNHYWVTTSCVVVYQNDL